jgi:hypothetical protein
MENNIGCPHSGEFICGLTDFFTSSGPSTILSIISDKCRVRHVYELVAARFLAVTRVPRTASEVRFRLSMVFAAGRVVLI